MKWPGLPAKIWKSNCGEQPCRYAALPVGVVDMVGVTRVWKEWENVRDNQNELSLNRYPWMITQLGNGLKSWRCQRFFSQQWQQLVTSVEGIPVLKSIIRLTNNIPIWKSWGARISVKTVKNCDHKSPSLKECGPQITSFRILVTFQHLVNFKDFSAMQQKRTLVWRRR